jgi:hypothetical protein
VLQGPKVSQASIAHLKKHLLAFSLSVPVTGLRWIFVSLVCEIDGFVCERLLYALVVDFQFLELTHLQIICTDCLHCLFLKVNGNHASVKLKSLCCMCIFSFHSTGERRHVNFIEKHNEPVSGRI